MSKNIVLLRRHRKRVRRQQLNVVQVTAPSSSTESGQVGYYHTERHRRLLPPPQTRSKAAISSFRSSHRSGISRTYPTHTAIFMMNVYEQGDTSISSASVAEATPRSAIARRAAMFGLPVRATRAHPYVVRMVRESTRQSDGDSTFAVASALQIHLLPPLPSASGGLWDTSAR